MATLVMPMFYIIHSALLHSTTHRSADSFFKESLG